MTIIASYRCFFAGFTSAFLVFFLCPPFIKLLKGKFLVSTRTFVTDFQNKSKTPSFGGLLIFLSVMISSLIWCRINAQVITILISYFLFLLLGLSDDILKVRNKNHTGFSAKQKFLGQILISFLIALVSYLSLAKSNILYIPFFLPINIGLLQIALSMLVIISTCNAVNLTDGLDGLAIGAVIFSTIAFIVISCLMGNNIISSSFNTLYIPGSSELTVFLSAILGASLGFLWYNSHPAKIFMGDTGSLSLGAVVATSSILTKHELSLLIIGGIFVIETLSVMIQVYFFKRYNKCIFKMAPIHHHFRELGWSETQVVTRFWILCIIFMFLGILLV